MRTSHPCWSFLASTLLSALGVASAALAGPVSCDENSLLSAIAQANASGGGVITFACQNTTIPMSEGLGDIYDNVVIDGEGKNITLEYVTNFLGCAPGSNGLGAPAIGNLAGTGSVVRGLRFVNYLEALHIEGPGNTIENNEFVGHACSDDAVSMMVLTALDATIRGNYFEGYVNDTVQLGFGGGVVEQNLFVDCGQPIRAPFGNTAGQPFFVRDNAFVASTDPNACSGPYFDGDYTLVFERNTVQCSRGLRIGGNTEAIVRENEIRNNGQVGMRVSGYAVVSAESNWITGNGFVPGNLPAGGVVIQEAAQVDLGGGSLTIGEWTAQSVGDNHIEGNAVADVRNLLFSGSPVEAENNCWDGQDASSIQDDIEGNVDFDPFHHVGALEICDGLDNDCDGVADEDCIPELVCAAGDINEDGTVDGVDLALMGVAFGASRGRAGYDPAADLTMDGRVDGIDLAILATDFGTDPGCLAPQALELARAGQLLPEAAAPRGGPGRRS